MSLSPTSPLSTAQEHPHPKTTNGLGTEASSSKNTPLNAKARISLVFVSTGLGALVLTALLGCIAAAQFCFPEFSQTFPFYKTRPIHVSLGLCWVFFGAIGSVYYYIKEQGQKNSFSPQMAKLHYLLFASAGVAILGCYILGIFGGREYFEYPPIISIAIFVGWLLFAANFYRVLPTPFFKMPVYLWMWSTAMVVFICAFTEAHLWMLPHFGGNVVRDMTVQWKSLGSLVASWNLLIYGIAACTMSRISGDDKSLYAKRTFALFFIGITNSFFNWGHHTYTVPSKPWVQHIAYFVSMTELVILFYCVTSWLRGLSEAKKRMHILSYRFLFASDVWVILNLIVALAISVPAFNVFAHGTHIIVAHSMGSIVGINTMILLAAVFYILSEVRQGFLERFRTTVTWGFWMMNLSLAFFWLCLLGAGFVRGAIVADGKHLNFALIQEAVQPYILFMILPGAGIFVGLAAISYPVFSGVRSALSTEQA